MEGHKNRSIAQILLVQSLLVFTSHALGGDSLNLRSGIIKAPYNENLQSSLQSLQTGREQIRALQFKTKISVKDQKWLKEIGLRTLRYLPEDTFIVKGTRRDFEFLLKSTPQVRALFEMSPEWKVDPELLTIAGKVTLLVQIYDAPDLRRTKKQIEKWQGTKILNAQNELIVIETDALMANNLAHLDAIEWIQVYPMIQTMDFKGDHQSPSHLSSSSKSLDGKSPIGKPPEITGFESGNRLIGMDSAWKRGWTGQGETAAMADTGLDTGTLSSLHADFGTRVPKGFAIGWGSSTWSDPQGHGTHVAGSVVGDGKSSDGKIKGGAFNAQFVPVGLWSPMMNNLMFDQDFNKIIGQPVKEGARVHSNSWGAEASGAYDAFATKVDAYLWENQNALVLFAAGNSGKDLDKNGKIDPGSIASPGTAKNVLTVGASENTISTGGIQKQHKDLKEGMTKWGAEPITSDTLSNNANGIACFSSVGPTKDGRIKPEIVAPGTNIVSTRSKDPKATLLWGEFDANYVWAGGTSMATPITAGAATVLREYLVKDRKLVNPSGALLKATLIHTAKDLAPGQYGTSSTQELAPRPDGHQGFGRVDVDHATSLTTDTLLIDQRDGVGLNESQTVQFKVGVNGTLHVTLSYMDAPGSAAAGKALVNDLDIFVKGPGKGLGRPEFRRADAINNTEMLELKGLSPGLYAVSVQGMNIPQGKNGKVPYALVVSE